MTFDFYQYEEVVSTPIFTHGQQSQLAPKGWSSTKRYLQKLSICDRLSYSYFQLEKGHISNIRFPTASFSKLILSQKL